VRRPGPGWGEPPEPGDGIGPPPGAELDAAPSQDRLIEFVVGPTVSPGRSPAAITKGRRRRCRAVASTRKRRRPPGSRRFGHLRTGR